MIYSFLYTSRYVTAIFRVWHWHRNIIVCIGWQDYLHIFSLILLVNVCITTNIVNDVRCIFCKLSINLDQLLLFLRSFRKSSTSSHLQIEVSYINNCSILKILIYSRKTFPLFTYTANVPTFNLVKVRAIGLLL